MPKALGAEHGQRSGDTVQDTLDVDVNHLVPFFDAQIIKGCDRRDAGITDEDIQLAVPRTGQAHESGKVFTPLDVGGKANRFTASLADAGGEGRKAIRISCAPKIAFAADKNASER